MASLTSSSEWKQGCSPVAKIADTPQEVEDSFGSISKSYSAYMLGGFNCSTRNRAKAIGQFLTPQPIFAPMIRAAVSEFARNPLSRISIVDPFCGDGRLLCALLTELAKFTFLESVSVNAWDIDNSILQEAQANIKRSASSLPFKISLNISKCDAFCSAMDSYGKYDICVTNPPWSSTKSLKARAFESEEEYKKYQELASLYGAALSVRFPEAAKGRSFGTGAINMSRFGAALSWKLLRPTGICGIVMPASFTTDTSSKKLRNHLLDSDTLLEAHYYPAELNLFETADIAAVTLVLAKNGSNEPAPVVSHMPERETVYFADKPFQEYSHRNGFVIPLGYSSAEMALTIRVSKLPKVADRKSISLGREVDETRIAERLCDQSAYRFVKGFMISNYTLIDREKWFYNDRKASIPASARAEKVVWRDISRVSQVKRIKATLLPSGFVAGNSLGVATASSGAELRAFLGILNSRLFEFMARTVLTTNHVSAGSIKQLPYPEINEEDEAHLAQLVDSMLNAPNMESYDAIDKFVADVYGLEPQEYKIVKERINFTDLNSY